jgi:predicted DCC family thiol-disulfide oxidoreductase YuxK
MQASIAVSARPAALRAAAARWPRLPAPVAPAPVHRTAARAPRCAAAVGQQQQAQQQQQQQAQAAKDYFATDARPIILYGEAARGSPRPCVARDLRASLGGVVRHASSASTPAPPRPPDGVCGLCNRGVNLILDWDPAASFRLAALQSPAGRALLARAGRAPDDISSIVLVTRDEGCFVRSEAVRRIGAALGAPFAPLAALAAPVPLPLRDFLYDRVASSRYNFFGRSDACRLTDAGPRAARFIVD